MSGYLRNDTIVRELEDLDLDAGGDAVFVACWEANTLERIDTRTLEVTGRAAVGEGPRAFGMFLR